MPARTAAILGALLIALGVAAAIGLPRWTAAVVEPDLPALRPEMLVLPPGEFWMGSGDDDPDAQGDEKPRHRVRIPQRFALGRTEVTQAQWRAVMGGNPSYFREIGEDHPVERVTWFAAVAYLNRLSEREGLAPCYEVRSPQGDPNDGGSEAYSSEGGFSYGEVTFQPGCTGYRLPTEAEWEYAARAGTTAPRYGELADIAWWSENSGENTHAVAGKLANPWFFFDLIGNVWEWTHSEYENYPADGQARVDAPATSWQPRNRVYRGCGWYNVAVYCRAAYRDGDPPGSRDHVVGFRPARFLDP